VADTKGLFRYGHHRVPLLRTSLFSRRWPSSPRIWSTFLSKVDRLQPDPSELLFPPSPAPRFLRYAINSFSSSARVSFWTSISSSSLYVIWTTLQVIECSCWPLMRGFRSIGVNFYISRSLFPVFLRQCYGFILFTASHTSNSIILHRPAQENEGFLISPGPSLLPRAQIPI